MIKGMYLSCNDDLSEVHSIRTAVFTNEYEIPAVKEADDNDIMAMHVILDFEGEKIGTGRMCFDGDTFILDKLAVLKDYRLNGYGEFIVRMLFDKVFQAEGNEIYLNSPKETIEFFKKIGFGINGDSYIEDNISYTPMKVKRSDVKTKCGHKH